ncbi:MAG: hypothetical protein ACI8PV_001934, partial [Dinoroseobacter sp.]
MPYTKIAILLLLGILVLVLLVQRIRRRRGVRIPLGISTVLFFGLNYLMVEQTHPISLYLPILDDTTLEQGFATAFWLAIAYTCNVFIKRFVYLRRLTLEGDPKVPLIIQYLVTVLLYMGALMVIVRSVYDQPIFAI